MKLRGIGEDKLVAALLRDLPGGPDVVRGPGDDCAVIGSARAKNWQLLKTDCVVEGIHFLPREDGRKIGWKAMARTISDIAAMGGCPQHALVTMAISPKVELKRARAIYDGLRKCAERYGVAIVGGETSRSPGPAFISVMLTGKVERRICVFRSGGKPGDKIYVTGRLGGSLRGRHLAFEPRVQEARWLALRFQVHAMMDLSDGLGADLPRLAGASGCGYRIDEAKLPLNPRCTVKQAMSDGEDYEMLLALPAREAARLEILWPRKFPALPLTEIGELTEAGAGKKTRHNGYDHFA
ncbi:MAG TPA: thiamine-phosphate kinase [Chthoniobacteraceae bacterium]|jgi:thiamine-monophosphate kinase|nr:thiamine-phosphate kinase [Chthoniobacteraceae bacterium]